LQSEALSQILLVKVYGHSDDQLCEETDRLAVAGADKESDDEDIMYPEDRGKEIIFNWVNNAGKAKSHTWCPTGKRRIKVHQEKKALQMRSRKTHAEIN